MRRTVLCTIVGLGLLATFPQGSEAQWVQTNGPMGCTVNYMAVMGTYLFAEAMPMGGTSVPQGVYRSTNDGATWTGVNSGLPSPRITALAVNGTNLFVGSDSGVFRSTDSGASWSAANSGLPAGSASCLCASGTDLFACAGGGVYRSGDSGTSWVSVGLVNTNVYCLATIGTMLFAGGHGGVYRSGNRGASWAPVDSGLTYNGPSGPTQAGVSCLAVSGTSIFAGTNAPATGAGVVFLSTDSGATWGPVYAGLPTAGGVLVNCLAVSGTNVYAGMSGGAGVFLSTNNGASWSPTGPVDSNGTAFALVVCGMNLFAGTYNNGSGCTTVCRPGGVWRFPINVLGAREPEGDLRGHSTAGLDLRGHLDAYNLSGQCLGTAAGAQNRATRLCLVRTQTGALVKSVALFR